MEPLNQEPNSNQSVEQNPQTPQVQQPEKTNKFGKHFIFLLTLLIISLVGAGLVFAINSVSEEIEKQEVVQDSFSWEGRWTFSEVNSSGSGSAQTWVYTLDIAAELAGEQQVTVSVDGFQTMTRINAVAEKQGDSLDIVFKSFATEGSKSTQYQNGDVLFSLTPNQSHLEVEWKAMKPQLESSVEGGVFLKDVAVDEYANWKTYRNEEYGFEFEYPAKLGEIENADSQKEKLNCNSNAYSEVLLVSFTHFTLQLACPTAVELNPSQGYRGEKEKILVAGRDSFYFDYVSVVGYHNKEVYIPLDENHYLNIGHSFKLREGYVELTGKDFMGILSTFKFFYKTSADTSKWNTYTNKYFGYSIKYPDDYVVGPTDDVHYTKEGDYIDIQVYPKTRKGRGLILEAKEISLYKNSEGDWTVYALNLDDFAKKIWEMNNPEMSNNIFSKNEHLTPLEKTIVAGQNSYKFSLDNSFSYVGGGGVLVGPSVFILTSSSGFNYIIYYKADDVTSEKILSTFKFTK